MWTSCIACFSLVANNNYFCLKRCVTKSITIGNVDADLEDFLTGTSPTEAGLNLYIRCLLKTYDRKIAKINKIRRVANEEIDKIRALRQSLVEKNLAGLYSDDIFREQNVILENKIAVAENSKDNALIDQYNMEAIEAFIREKLSDLGATYKKDKKKLLALRCLLGSIFPSGMLWEYPGISNQQISPIYQSIRDTMPGHAPFGDPSSSCFESSLAWLDHIRRVFEESEKQNDI